MPRLSSITITGNEAANIVECLDSVAFCDERVVVDGGSTDGTAAIAQQRGARVFHHAWTDFGTQKRIALSHAMGDWVLLIDADERVSPALAAEITNAVASGSADGYEIPRRSYFCGRWMRHSGWSPDYVLRLFRRDKGRISQHKVHERVICEGRVARLKEPLTHFAIRRLEDTRVKIEAYSTAGAEQILASGRRVNSFSRYLHGVAAFLRMYVWRLGFLDGREGFQLALANYQGTYQRYLKAWRGQQRRG